MYFRVVILVFLLLVSCDDCPNIQEIKKLVTKTYPLVHSRVYEIASCQDVISDDLDYKLVDVVYQSKDTSEHLLVRYYDSDSVHVESYTQTTHLGKRDLVLHMTYDTLFYYSLNKVDSSLFFYRGKYYYLFQKMMLTSGQHKYFLDNSDSLRVVRGNDLPPLPDIDTLDN